MDGNGKDGADGVFGILSALEDGFDFVQGSRFVKVELAVHSCQSLLGHQVGPCPIDERWSEGVVHRHDERIQRSPRRLQRILE